MLKQIIIYSIMSIILLSIIFSLISQYFLGLPYGWNIEATNSMVPKLNPGCLIFIIPLVGQPHVGQIVAYRPPFYSHYIVHEIIKVLPNGYITKGIHNPSSDPWVVSKAWIKGCVPLIFGRPIAIPYIGYAITTINTLAGKVYLLSLLFAIYGISEAVSRRSIKIRRSKNYSVISVKSVFFGLFILFFLIFFIVLSANTILTYAYWTSASIPLTLHQKEIGVSFKIGVVPSGSNVSLILPITIRNFPLKLLPLAVLFYSNSSNLKLVGPYQILKSVNITFVLNVGKPGYHSSRVGFLLIPSVLPYNLMEQIFEFSPILFIIFMSLFLSGVLVLFIWIIYKILDRYYIL